METEKLYRNKDWLKDKYLEKQLSTYQIAKLCKCGHVVIGNWLRNHNIPIRFCKIRNHLSYKRKIGNDKYCNGDWLKEKYLKEKLSASQISKLCNVNHHTILHWLNEFNIPTRSFNDQCHFSRGNHCNLSNEAIEWINGELLGDGCLQHWKSYSAKISYGSKYKEYIDYVSDILLSFRIKQMGKIRKRYHEDMNCYTYNYQSCYYAELLPIYKQWYPEPERKKVIPRDLKLTPLVLRQEYIGDGCLSHPKKRKPCITLATCGFLVKDVKWLINQLNKLGFKATRRPANNIIAISSYSTRAFLDYIGKCPVKCYQYKFRY